MIQRLNESALWMNHLTEWPNSFIYTVICWHRLVVLVSYLKFIFKTNFAWFLKQTAMTSSFHSTNRVYQLHHQVLSTNICRSQTLKASVQCSSQMCSCTNHQLHVPNHWGPLLNKQMHINCSETKENRQKSKHWEINKQL